MRGPARAIIIDDDPIARLHVAAVLRGSSVLEVVGEAGDGMRGAELAEAVQPHLVVLDIAMPRMDGFECLPLLRTLCPRARIVVRSSYDDEQVRERVAALGAHDFVSKMLDPMALRVRLERCVARPTRVLGSAAAARPVTACTAEARRDRRQPQREAG